MPLKRDKSKEKSSSQKVTRSTEAGSSNNPPPNTDRNLATEEESEQQVQTDPVEEQNSGRPEQIALNETLQRYITNIVNATIGLTRSEDLRARQVEYEEERVKIRAEVVNTIRDTLRAPTPPAGEQSVHGTPRPEEHSTAVRPTTQTGNPEHPEISENARNFLSQMDALNLNTQSPSISNNASRSSTNRALEFHKWGLKFDNIRMTVDDFILRLKRLKASYNVSWEDLFLHFHLFVTGSVESWFWTFLKTNPNANWTNLELALIEQYRSIETDSELSRKMFDRRQGPYESFDDFYNAILTMNARLHCPKPRRELIELIKQNVKKRTGELLITFNTTSLAEMVYVCRSIEKHAQNQNEHFRAKPLVQNNMRKQVSELDGVLLEDECFEIDALNVSQAQQNFSNYTCWNCKNKGHSFVQCPDQQRNLFCYKCGAENTTTPKCVKCSGNRTRGNPTTGEVCHPKTKPAQA